jgi:TPR repeat protein
MGEVLETTTANRWRARRGGGFLWILIVLGVLAAALVSIGIVSLNRASRDPALIYGEARKAYVEGDPETALRKWMHASSLGHAAAKNDLADMYIDGYVIQKSYTKAFDLYREAAELGHAPAQTNLGLMYETGRGTAADDEQAAALYHLAAARGYAAAQTRLGWLYERGRGLEQSDADAFHWYRLAAAQGDPEGQVRLGRLFKHGRGVDESPADALFWFQEAAKHGNAGGQTELGLMCQEGRGLPQDWGRAGRWFEQAAKQDHAPAQYLLGEMYYHGNGVTRDYAVSAEWFREAAEGGNQPAKQALDRLDLELRSRGVEREAQRAEPERAGAIAEATDRADENRPGHCEIGTVVELRSRLDCLSRGGVFKATEGDDTGSFVTLDDRTSWSEQRRDLRLVMPEAEQEVLWPEESRPGDTDEVIEARSSSSPSRSSDWIVCYDHGATSDRSSFSGYRAENGRLRCLKPLPKPAGENGSQYCRDSGYSSRRFFKHETSARRWEDENCR